MKDIIYEFLDYILLERKYSDYTETSYELDLFKYEEYLNDHKINYLKVNYNNISEFIIYLKKSGYKSTSINRILSTLRSFYKYLEKNKKIINNPFSMVSSLKTEKRLPNYFKYDEFNKMIDTLEKNPLDIRNRLILEMLLATGLRVSELANIKLNDIDYINQEIKVMGKGSKERIVYYGSYAADSLDKYLNESRNILLNGRESQYLFINNNGGNLTTRGIRLIIDNIVKKACINSKVSPHTFRHTFATIMLNEGCDIKSVQELLGHSSLSTTGIYTHLTNEEVRRAYLNAHPRAKEQFMEDKETKYLAAVFGVVIFVILLVIVLALINTSTAFNHANYDVPTSTTSKVKHELSDYEKISYNTNLSEKGILIAFNNVIKGKISYNDTNLLDSDESKYIFIYSYLKNREDVEIVDSTLLQNYAMRIFKVNLDDNQISAYYSNDSYYYEIDNNIQYILKVKDVRKKGDFTYIDVDILGYNEELIDSSITNYSNNLIIKTGTIVAQNIGGQLCLNSFALHDREDEK